jgi:hypothetical protein
MTETRKPALRKSEPPIGDEDEFSRGYRLGNRDGIEFGIEQTRGEDSISLDLAERILLAHARERLPW